MGLFGAMTAGVSGLNAQGQAIGIISDNLANTNTVGYKTSRALFSQLVTSAGAGGTSYNSGGVDTAVLRDTVGQGSFISSTSKTDLAISGSGFFRVADSKTNTSDTSYYFTRAGSFSENKEGYLVNPDGYYLQGWRTDADGTILNVQDITAVELQSVGVSAQATTEFAIDANLTSTEDINTVYSSIAKTLSNGSTVDGTLLSSLNAVVADPTLADYVTDIRVYDAQGGARDMTVAFTKRSANTWDWQIYTDGGNVQGGTSGTNTRVGRGTLEFSTTGALKYATGTNLNINWAGGVNPSAIDLNFGSYTGGNVASAVSGVGFESSANPVSSTTITGASSFAVTAGTTLVNGTTYTLRRVDATNVALYSADNSAVVEAGPIAVATSGAQTITFPGSGITITTGASFDMSAVANNGSVGTFTMEASDILGVSVENDTLGTGAYTLQLTGAGQVGIFNSLNVQVGSSVSVGSSGSTRELYFPTAGVRVTVSDNFDGTASSYPMTVSSFTISTAPQLADGAGSDGVTQMAASYNTKSINQNGFGAGTLSSITVDESGFVNGTFTNGETKKLYKIALAMFQNPNGLEAVSGSLYRTTDASGNALMKESGVGGAGKLVGGSLEGSTTDIAGEFSNMIVAQRAFQASSKVITTVDQMLNELLQLR